MEGWKGGSGCVPPRCCVIRQGGVRGSWVLIWWRHTAGDLRWINGCCEGSGIEGRCGGWQREELRKMDSHGHTVVLTLRYMSQLGLSGVAAVCSMFRDRGWIFAYCLHRKAMVVEKASDW